MTFGTIEQQLTHGKIPPDELLLQHTVKLPKKLNRTLPSPKSPPEPIEDDSQNNSLTSAADPGLLNDQQSPSTVRSPLVAKILETNLVCADCGNTDPEYVCINCLRNRFGVLLFCSLISVF